MEVTHAVPHRAFEVRESSQPGEVRRASAQLARDLGFDEVATGRVALVATELASNLVRHAAQGRMLVAPVRADDGSPMVELLSLDSGPGIANLAACLADGFSTGGTPGTGLGAVRRLAAEFDVYSQPGAGTVILARVAGTSAAAMPVGKVSQAPFRVGAVALCAPGETACGDAWDAVQQDGGIAVMVADGLGHGPQAAEASAGATAVFREDPLAMPSQLLARAHLRLKATRGAAVAMAQVDAEQETIIFCGVGNIIGRIVSGVEDRTLLSQNGTAGVQIRTVQDVRHAFAAHALLVMHSDGIASRWKLQGSPGLLQHHPTLVAAWLIRDHCRGHDDATVVVIRRRA
jgi:anti-sigma regulatory factor (Ser/Thr protein kinase)